MRGDAFDPPMHDDINCFIEQNITSMSVMLAPGEITTQPTLLTYNQKSSGLAITDSDMTSVSEHIFSVHCYSYSYVPQACLHSGTGAIAGSSDARTPCILAQVQEDFYTHSGFLRC